MNKKHINKGTFWGMGLYSKSLRTQMAVLYGLKHVVGAVVSEK